MLPVPVAAAEAVATLPVALPDAVPQLEAVSVTEAHADPVTVLDALAV